MKCPKCKEDMEEIMVKVKGVIHKITSYQCDCGYFTFDQNILDYLEYANKIAFDKAGNMGWIFNPKLYDKYSKR